MMGSLSRRAAAVVAVRIERGGTPTSWSLWPPITEEAAAARAASAKQGRSITNQNVATYNTSSKVGDYNSRSNK